MAGTWWRGWAWRRWAPVWLPALALSPSLAWIARDRSVWSWDQAWYGQCAVELYRLLRDEPLAWPAAMLDALGSKPPAVAWTGQLFVPLGAALGSVDDALRLSAWLTHAVALGLVFAAVRALSGRDLAAAVAVLVPASAPLFARISSQFLAEPAQTLAIAWSVLVMSRAPWWGRSRTAAHLVAAGSLALLAKLSSPAYVVGPALVAGAFLRRRARRGAEAVAPGDGRGWWAVALLAAAATVLWYARNLGAALDHALQAGIGPVAELYGWREPFLPALGHWVSRAWRLLWPLAPLFGLAAAMGRPGSAAGPPPSRHFDLCALVSLGQVALVLCALALTPNRDARFTSPLLPYMGLLAAWAVVRAGRSAVAWAATAALAVQLALVQGLLLGLLTAAARHPHVRWLWPGLAAPVTPEGSRDPKEAVLAAVRRTCGAGATPTGNPRSASGPSIFVGVDLPWLNGHSLSYVAAQERLAGRAGHCRYFSAAFTTPELAAATLESGSFLYWIAVDPLTHPVPPEHEFLNRSAPAVFGRLRESGRLQPEPWNGPPGLLLFRFVGR